MAGGQGRGSEVTFLEQLCKKVLHFLLVGESLKQRLGGVVALSMIGIFCEQLEGHIMLELPQRLLLAFF